MNISDLHNFPKPVSLQRDHQGDVNLEVFFKGQTFILKGRNFIDYFGRPLHNNKMLEILKIDRSVHPLNEIISVEVHQGALFARIADVFSEFMPGRYHQHKTPIHPGELYRAPYGSLYHYDPKCKFQNAPLQETPLTHPPAKKASKYGLQKVRSHISLVKLELQRAANRYHLDPAQDIRPPQLSQEASTHYQAWRKIAWSYAQYMNEALYNKRFGYYSTRANQFHTSPLLAQSNLSGNFETYATTNPLLAHMVGFQAYFMWRAMIEAGDIGPGETFQIVELGAGLGLFSANLLDFLELQTRFSPSQAFEQFWNCLQYTIGEISPELQQKQGEINAAWIGKGKLRIVPTDARHLAAAFERHSIKGLVFSNELPDAFPVNELCLTFQNQLMIRTVVPSLKKGNLDLLPKETQERLVLEDKRYRHRYGFADLVEGIPAHLTLLAVNELDHFPVELIKELAWHDVLVPLEAFPEVEAVCRSIGYEFFMGMRPTKPVYVNHFLDSFMEGVACVLDKGFVVTVDYGDTHSSENRPDTSLRTYGGSEKIGEFDITSDVHFTMLAELGKKRALNVVHYGPQLSLYRTPFDVDQGYYYATPSNNPRSFFHSLVQKSQSTKARFYVPHALSPVSYFATYKPCAVLNEQTSLEDLLINAFERFQKMPDPKTSEDLARVIEFLYPDSSSPVIHSFVDLWKEMGTVAGALSKLQSGPLPVEPEEQKFLIRVFTKLVSATSGSVQRHLFPSDSQLDQR